MCVAVPSLFFWRKYYQAQEDCLVSLLGVTYYCEKINLLAIIAIEM